MSIWNIGTTYYVQIGGFFINCDYIILLYVLSRAQIKEFIAATTDIWNFLTLCSTEDIRSLIHKKQMH